MEAQAALPDLTVLGVGMRSYDTGRIFYCRSIDWLLNKGNKYV